MPLEAKAAVVGLISELKYPATSANPAQKLVQAIYGGYAKYERRAAHREIKPTVGTRRLSVEARGPRGGRKDRCGFGSGDGPGSAAGRGRRWRRSSRRR